MRVAKYAKSGLHPRIKGYEGLADDACCEHANAHTHTPACCSINQFKVATRDHRLHGFGRPTAAVSTQLCFADNINSGLHLKDLADQLLLHPRVKGYKSLAVQMQLRAVFDQMLL